MSSLIAYRKGPEVRIFLAPDGTLYHHGDGGPRYLVTEPAMAEWLEGAHPVSGWLVYREPQLSMVAGPGVTADPIYVSVAPGIAVPWRYQFPGG